MDSISLIATESFHMMAISRHKYGLEHGFDSCNQVTAFPGTVLNSYSHGTAVVG